VSDQSRLVTSTRSGTGSVEEPYEKAVTEPTPSFIDHTAGLLSIIDPRLADPVRRQALEFTGELNRAA